MKIFSDGELQDMFEKTRPQKISLWGGEYPAIEALKFLDAGRFAVMTQRWIAEEVEQGHLFRGADNRISDEPRES